jgi:hypothetical protein
MLCKIRVEKRKIRGQKIRQGDRKWENMGKKYDK